MRAPAAGRFDARNIPYPALRFDDLFKSHTLWFEWRGPGVLRYRVKRWPVGDWSIVRLARERVLRLGLAWGTWSVEAWHEVDGVAGPRVLIGPVPVWM